MTLRPIKPDDLSKLSQWADDHDIVSLKKLIDLPAFLGIVLEFENDIVGFTYGWHFKGNVEIIQITVHPDHRRHGYGQRLLDHFIDAVEAVSCRLEVRADNVAALALYEGYGFIKNSIRANYYHDTRGRIDAVLMTYKKSDREEN